MKSSVFLLAIFVFIHSGLLAQGVSVNVNNDPAHPSAKPMSQHIAMDFTANKMQGK